MHGICDGIARISSGAAVDAARRQVTCLDGFGLHTRAGRVLLRRSAPPEVLEVRVQPQVLGLQTNSVAGMNQRYFLIMHHPYVLAAHGRAGWGSGDDCGTEKQNFAHAQDAKITTEVLLACIDSASFCAVSAAACASLTDVCIAANSALASSAKPRCISGTTQLLTLQVPLRSTRTYVLLGSVTHDVDI